MRHYASCEYQEGLDDPCSNDDDDDDDDLGDYDSD